MHTVIHGDWHAWESNKGVMLSDEANRKLRSDRKSVV